MNYAELKSHDIANGLGVRVSLFVSGCTHRCKGCFNEIAWDFGYGTPFTDQTEEKILSLLAPAHIAGLTLLGGEPMEAVNQRGLLSLLRRVKKTYPNKDIWCYSGYTFEELTGKVACRARCEVTDEVLSLIDVLVDGRFEEKNKNIMLKFRGSSNQRILLLPASLQKGYPILHPLQK